MTRERGANVDPGALTEFAQELRRLSSGILQINEDIERGLSRLGRTFRDEHYDGFCRSFVESRQKLTECANEIRLFVPLLLEDAEDIARSQSVKLKDYL